MLHPSRRKSERVSRLPLITSASAAAKPMAADAVAGEVESRHAALLPVVDHEKESTEYKRGTVGTDAVVAEAEGLERAAWLKDTALVQCVKESVEACVRQVDHRQAQLANLAVVREQRAD